MLHLQEKSNFMGFLSTDNSPEKMLEINMNQMELAPRTLWLVFVRHCSNTYLY